MDLEEKLQAKLSLLLEVKISHCWPREEAAELTRQQRQAERADGDDQEIVCCRHDVAAGMLREGAGQGPSMSLHAALS